MREGKECNIADWASGPLEVSELSFGTWLTVAGGIAREQAIRCIHAALDHGITLFDTANQYGAGEAERVLGEALRSYPRDRYLIATKLYFPVGDEPDHGLSARRSKSSSTGRSSGSALTSSISTSATASTRRRRLRKR